MRPRSLLIHMPAISQKNYSIFELEVAPYLGRLEHSLLSKLQNETKIHADPTTGSMQNGRDLLKETKRLVHNDIDSVAHLNHADPLTTAREKSMFLLELFCERVRCAVLQGWLCREVEMKQCIKHMLHEYFAAAVAEFAKIFSLEHISASFALDRKLEIIRHFYETSSQWTSQVQAALAILRIRVSPEPKLSDMFDTRSLLLKYTNMLYHQMKTFIGKVFEASVRTSNREQFKDAPWAPSLVNKRYFSSIPKDLMVVLNQCVGYAALPDLEKLIPAAHSADIVDMNDRIEIDYIKCFSRLASHYRRQIVSVPWEKLDWKTVDINEYAIWLCSIVNDTSRLLSEKHLCRGALSAAENVNAYVIDEKRKEVVAKYGKLQMDVLDVISSLMFERLLSTEDALAFEGFSAALQSELVVFRDYFYDADIFGLFCTVVANKSLILFVFWISQELSKVGQGFMSKTTDDQVRKCIDRICSSFLDSRKVLTPVYKQFSQCGINIIDNLESNLDDLPTNGLWIVPPEWMEPYMDELTKLNQKILDSRNPSLLNKMMYTILNSESSSIMALLTNHKYKALSKRTSYLNQPSKHMRFWGSQAADKQTEETSFLSVRSVKASNLRVYDSDIDYQDLRAVHVEFVLEEFSHKLDLHLSSDSQTWESMSSCGVKIPLDESCIAKCTITVIIRFSCSLIRQNALFGSIKIPLVFIDPLNNTANYPVEIHDKAMEDNMKASFRRSMCTAFPTVSFVMSVE